MLIRTWSLDDVTILDVSGHLGVASASALSEAVGEAIRMRRHRLIVNLLQVTRADASGLGELVRAFRAVGAASGDVRVVVRSPVVRDLLVRTQLVSLFPTYDTEAAALASFEMAVSSR